METTGALDLLAMVVAAAAAAADESRSWLDSDLISSGLRQRSGTGRLALLSSMSADCSFLCP